jgi:hypothetical protein
LEGWELIKADDKSTSFCLWCSQVSQREVEGQNIVNLFKIGFARYHVSRDIRTLQKSRPPDGTSEDRVCIQYYNISPKV